MWEYGAAFDEKVRGLRSASLTKIASITEMALADPVKSYKHVHASMTHTLRKAKPPFRRAPGAPALHPTRSSTPLALARAAALPAARRGPPRIARAPGPA